MQNKHAAWLIAAAITTILVLIATFSVLIREVIP